MHKILQKTTSNSEVNRLKVGLLFLLLFFSAAGFTQNQTQPISLNLKNATLRDFIRQIESKSKFTVIYRDVLIDDKKDISIQTTSRPLNEVVKIVLSSKGLQANFNNNTIVITKAETASRVEAGETPISRKVVSGRVTDSETGEPIIGASVVEKGTTNGILTDVDGNFHLNVPANATLSVTYIGFTPVEVNTIGKNTVMVSIEEDAKTLEDLVVVGYGVEKKVNLTGSVSSINMSELAESRPITNVSTGLSGLVPGLHVNSGSNRPGDDNATLLIRGQGTLNNSAPLIIVDGVESEISNVNPADIENMSVLKDAASSAIYGSRAANGVVLITTKKGKAGTIKLDVNSYISNQSAAKTIVPVSNYADYMELMNEAMSNSGMVKPFSEGPDGMIQLWRDNEGKDPLKYPNTDWRNDVLRDAISQNHSVSLSGGTDKISFYSSFRYLDNPGIIENTGISRYDFRASINAKLKDWISLGFNLTKNKYNYSVVPNSTISTIFNGAPGTPGMVLRSPDQRFGAPNNVEDSPSSRNPLRDLNSISGEDIESKDKSQFTAIITPVKGLTLNGSYTYSASNRQSWNKPVGTKTYNFLFETVASEIADVLSVSYSSANTHQHFMDATATYENKLFDKLFYKTLLGVSQETFSFENFGASKLDLIDPSLRVLNAATGISGASGTKYEWAMRSYFGRIQFNWSEKYLLEMNIRRDGSSRFKRENRWGYFPSISAAWRIDQENFMNSSKEWLSNFKLRASYGSLGNNSVGNYEIIPQYAVGMYVLNSEIVQAIVQNSIVNENLTWEKTYVANFGMDIGLFKNRLSSTIDIFNKKTEGILIALPAPLVNGKATLPKQNSATVVNNGIELSLGWEDRIQDFRYYIKSNFSYVKNKVTKYKGDEYSLLGTGLIKEGLPIGTQFLLTTDRIISNDKDLALVQNMIDNAPIDEITGERKNPFAAFGKPGLGDILYKDMDGNGVIDNDDRRTFGKNGTNPLFTFGSTLGAEYKGFDFSILLQGVAGLKLFYQDAYYSPYLGLGVGINKEIAEGRWYEGRITPAKFPKLMEWTGSKQNTLPSDFWLADKSYLKIRNIQLGYSLPKQLLSKIALEKVRIYSSLENFFTFTSYPGIDPEVFNTGYPTLRQIVVGVNFSL